MLGEKHSKFSSIQNPSTFSCILKIMHTPETVTIFKLTFRLACSHWSKRQFKNVNCFLSVHYFVFF
jgi:hypothetical protein